MADDQDKKEGQGEENDEFAFPSEDFQTSSEPSQEDEGSDFGSTGSGGEEEDLGGLPPLSDFESSSSTSDEDEDFGSLPPLSDIQVETPVPGGGAPKDTPASGGGAFATPASDSDLDTPMPGGLETPQEDKEDTTAFQDLAADSDFSPETPEIGPGPDTDLETPMFDSAFGGGDDDFGTPSSSTDAPTQAMETPMFGQSDDQGSGGGTGDEFGFDDNAFGGGGADFGAAPAAGGAAGGAAGFDAGTPVPDFSPDTGVGAATPPPTDAPAGKGKKAKAAKGGGKGASPLLLVAVFLIAAILGVVGGQFLSDALPLPNPLKAQIQELQSTVDQQQSTITRLTNLQGTEGTGSDVQQDVEALVNQKIQLAEEVAALKEEAATAQAEADEATALANDVQADLDELNNTYVTTRNDYEDLQNEMSIIRAQHEGMLAEIDRFQNLIGELDEANTRRMMTKDTLQSSVDRLAILVKEGMALTPSKYDRQQRIANVENLRNQLSDSGWVSPELLDSYTDLVMAELEIAKSREYFFAQIPVTNRYGYVEEKWAECLMNGNWGVYFRTLDGKQIGVYQNTSETGIPDFGFVQYEDGAVQKQIAQEIFANRPSDFDEKIAVIAERQIAADDRTSFQRAYDSL